MRSTRGEIFHRTVAERVFRIKDGKVLYERISPLHVDPDDLDINECLGD